MSKRRGASIGAILLAGSLSGACSSNSDEPEFAVTIEVSGAGHTDPAPGLLYKKWGSWMKVVATPDPGASFLGWEGAQSGLNPSTLITITGPTLLRAVFGQPLEVTTYRNPVLPGDHPDLNIYTEGDDFYLAGSNFHMMPAIEILHSKDLLHWERVSRVVPSTAAALKDQTGPGQGTWGGFIVKPSEGSYRLYYAINDGTNTTQYFSSAKALTGPWSEPVKVNTFAYTPPGSPTSYQRGTGSDNSVFTDPANKKTYMLIKNGLCKWDADHPKDFGINLVTEIDPSDGMLLPETTIDLSFINWDQQTGGCGDFSNADWSKWAEGPTMVKRGDWYYYFVSTHTACGGQMHAWASKVLQGSTAKDWKWLGYVLTGEEPYAGVQHTTAPFQLKDGTFWVFAHSYDCTNVGTRETKNGDWMGLGREGLLLQVTFVDTDVKGETIPVPKFTTKARDLIAPKLPTSSIPLLAPVNDEFTAETIGPVWTSYDKSESKYSVKERPGWLRVTPGAAETTWVVQKDMLHSSSMLSKVEFTPKADGDAAGLRLGNGYFDDQQVLSTATWMTSSEKFQLPARMELSLARVMHAGTDEVRLSYRTRAVLPLVGDASAYTQLADEVVVGGSVPAPSGATVWLKLVRTQHQATGWMSTDGLNWKQVGTPVDISALDGFYAMAHTWVGNQAGVFASQKSADFDFFSYRDGATPIPAAEADQDSGTRPVASSQGDVLGSLENGDWAMYGGVDLGSGGLSSKAIELKASAVKDGAVVEVWADPFASGKALAYCKVAGTGDWDKWATSSCLLNEKISGAHDVYLKVKGDTGELLRLASLRFVVQ